MTQKEHNGWTNYETWLVKLWMDNNESFTEQAEAFISTDDDNDDQIRELASLIRETHEESLPKLDGFAADLMNSALSEVNWEEIASSLLEDAKDALEV